MSPPAQNDHLKLFIPGPVEIAPATFEAMSAPMIGHRGGEFQALYGGIQPSLQKLFGTGQPVFLSTSSAWGVMEASIRNLVHEKSVLNCCCGAFSDKWFDVSRRCGKEARALEFEWGRPVDPEAVRRALAAGGFEAVTLVHNETSTGVMNPLKEIAEVVRSFDDVLLVVDTVSSFSAVPTPMDELGVDVLLTGSQKALALPPGLALFAVSERAFARAESTPGRGYYFDFLEFKKNQEKDMTPSTPCIHTIYGLRQVLEGIFAEGLENRYARHERLNNMVHDWVVRAGFDFLAPEGFRSKSLTCVKNTRGIDVLQLQQLMRENHRIAMDAGYGKLKGKAFRLSNMGNEDERTIQALLDALDDSLAKL